MKIASFNYLNKYPNIASFKGCNREYYDPKLKYDTETYGNICTFTKLFREDLNWLELASIIKHNFDDKDKVQVYSLACSDGSEAYSIGITLMELFPDYKKYFPIIAIDRDKTIIDVAKSHRINLSNYEISRIDSCIMTDKDYFIEKGKPIDITGDEDKYYIDRMNEKHSYSPIPELKNNIIFEQGNILDAINNLDDKGNSIIFCRNVFAYLPVTEHYEIITALSNKMKRNSLFVIGEYDNAVLVDRKLLAAGFKEVGKNIYQKA